MSRTAAVLTGLAAGAVVAILIFAGCWLVEVDIRKFFDYAC
jgi:hypothetical protein